MPDIPHQLVFRKIKHIMQRHRHFHHTQAGAQMPRVVRHHLNDVTTDFLAKGGQLLHGKPLKIGGRLDLVQYHVFV